MNKKIVILGSGESGTGAAMLAKKHHYDVFVSDKAIIPDNFKAELNTLGVAFEEGKHTEEMILNAAEIIKSPGIPDTSPLVLAAINKGIPVINELEFAARYTKAKIIAITGTNGKTTTTSLVYHLLKNANLDVVVGGNIGVSFARLLTQRDYEYAVLEVSSFQLDNMYQFKADIAVMTLLRKIFICIILKRKQFHLLILKSYLLVLL
jgi:UDP-N-acetylmuramoylalanine--D-glutamate ligase